MNRLLWHIHTTQLIIQRIIFSLFLVVILNSSCSQTMNPAEKLSNEIGELFASTNGDFAMAYQSLTDSADRILIREREVFHAASTMKTAVMIEVFKQAREGRFSLEDSLIVKNEFKSIYDDSPFSLDIGRDDGEHLYHQIGEKRPIKDLVVDMIIYSSNLATNLVIEWVGAGQVNKTMRELGAHDIQVLRGVEDMKAFDAGLNNSTTAYDLMVIFKKLGLEELVSKEDSREMIGILMRQTHNTLIPAKLPNEVKVANKTGWITGVHHDSGIVFLPDGRKYVLVLLSKNMEDAEAGTEMLAEVSRKVYDYFVAQ